MLNLKKIDQKRFWDDLYIGNYGEFVNLYHYTSPEGLINIIKKGKITLWFTRFDCLNDVSEGKDVLDCYNKVCYKMLIEKEIDEDFYNIIRDVSMPSKRFFMYPLKDEPETMYLTVGEYDAYLCCFSAEKDSLDMWRYYCKNNQYQGYNIELCSWIFSKLQDIQISNYKEIKEYGELSICDVIYDDAKKEEYIKNSISQCYLAFKEEISKDEVQGLLAEMLQKVQLIFKSAYFKSEKEIRALMYLPKQPLENLTIPIYEVKYRTKDGLIIPYIEVELEDIDYIQSISVGPLQEKDTAEKMLRSYLDSKNYKGVDINISGAPIRF